MIPELPIIIAYIGMGAAAVAIAVVAAELALRVFFKIWNEKRKKNI